MPREHRHSVLGAGAFLALILVSPVPSSAEQARELDTIVVTGTRSEKPLLDSPVRTHVVSREELQRQHARSLTEALRTVPGVLLKPVHGKSGYEVWMQGLSGDRVLVLIDGQPLAARTGSSVDLSQIAVQDVERIEIAKGAVSTLYGSRAMGGVINVITRDGGSGYTLQVDGGSYGPHDRDGTPAAGHLAASGHTRMGDLSMGLSGDWRETRGYDLEPDTYTAEGYAGSRGNLALDLAYELGTRTRASIRPDYYFEDSQRPFATFAPGQGQIRQQKLEQVKRWHLPASLETAIGRNTLEFTALYEHYQDRTAQDVVATPAVDQRREAVMELTRGELQWDRPWGEAHLLTAGVTATEESLRQEQRRVEGSQVRETTELEPGARRTSVEAYLQDDIFLGRHWELVPGLRYHYEDEFGSFLSPKINVLHQVIGRAGVTRNIRLGLGRGYRTPNLKERYFRFDHSALGYMVLGNPDLEPERSVSLQLGIEWVQPADWRLEANLYYNRLTNLITTAFDADSSAQQGLSIFRYQNVERATTRGVEMAASQQLGPLRLSAAYTHLRARDEETGNTLPGRPRHQGQLGLRWRIDALATAVGLDGTYQSREYVDRENTQTSPGWAQLDLRINTDVTRRLTAFVGIDNLTNVHRKAGDGQDQRPTEPRFGYLGLRYSQ